MASIVRVECGNAFNMPTDLSQRHQVIVHREHYLTKLIVLRAQNKVHHIVTKETLTEIQFEILDHQGKIKGEEAHYQLPLPPPMPEYCVSQQAPFESTGVYFAKTPLHLLPRQP